MIELRLSFPAANVHTAIPGLTYVDIQADPAVHEGHGRESGQAGSGEKGFAAAVVHVVPEMGVVLPARQPFDQGDAPAGESGSSGVGGAKENPACVGLSN